jgi:hypothetical protein
MMRENHHFEASFKAMRQHGYNWKDPNESKARQGHRVKSSFILVWRPSGKAREQ